MFYTLIDTHLLLITFIMAEPYNPYTTISYTNDLQPIYYSTNPHIVFTYDQPYTHNEILYSPPNYDDINKSNEQVTVLIDNNKVNEVVPNNSNAPLYTFIGLVIIAVTFIAAYYFISTKHT